MCFRNGDDGGVFGGEGYRVVVLCLLMSGGVCVYFFRFGVGSVLFWCFVYVVRNRMFELYL